jgi:uracil-DNA glycosylase family 4
VTALRDEYLAEIGIPVWQLRGSVAASAPAATPAPTEPPSEAAAVHARAPAASAAEAWSDLEAKVRACTLCALHRGRTQTVFGVGRRDARLFVIGEAPGADEDRQGEPFVGKAGQLLNAMLRSIGLPRADVFIANILKCRPPNNRDPDPGESASCTPYLSQQIELVQPRVLLAVGRISAQWLLQTDTPIGRLRGRVLTYGTRNTPLVVTYHPAYLLRSPLEKAKAWNDLCLVKELLSRSP